MINLVEQNQVPLGEKKVINLKRNLLFGSILIPILSRIVSMSY